MHDPSTGDAEGVRVGRALADRYRIERPIGEGGMASVYLALDLKHHRQVALKVMRPEFGATLGADRFLREVEIAARLRMGFVVVEYRDRQNACADAGPSYGAYSHPQGKTVSPRMKAASAG